jgi:hypothetical protein
LAAEEGEENGMIRRDLPAGDGAPKRWALISQIDHARLAGRLAEHWGAGGFAPLSPREELLWAIAHHDDGWKAWETAPQVDPATGVPRSFTEMEIDDSIAIWSASIDGAARAGNLQGYVVAGHFCALARRAAAWKKADPAWPRAEAFIAAYEGRMEEWLADWQKQNRPANTPAIARRALAYLQFFDSLSLWFCCAEATEPDTVETPDGPELTLAPETSELVRLSPWPLAVEQLDLEIAGRIVPAGRYGSSELLAAAASQTVLLRWELRPASGGGQKV